MFKVYQKILSYVPKQKCIVFVAIALTIVSTLLTTSAYYQIYLYLNQVLVHHNTSTAQMYAFGIVGLLILGGTVYILSVLLTHVVAFRLESNLRKKGIEGLLQSGFRFFDEHSSGTIRKIIDDNAEQTHSIVAHLIPDNASAVLTPVIALLIGFLIDLKVGIALLVICITGFVIIGFMAGDKKFLSIYQEALEKLSAETVEYIRGIQVVKAFGATVQSFKSLHKAIVEYSKNAFEYSKSCKHPWLLFQVLFMGTSSIIIALIVLFSGVQTDVGTQIVHLIMFVFMSGIIFGAFMRIMYVNMYAYQGMRVVEKLEEMFEQMQADALSFGDEKEFKDTSIAFEEVSFGYEEQLVLDKLSFRLAPNKIYAIVGPSGGGKSTIAKLISGFYKLNEGCIKIGDIPIENYSKEALMKNIAFVFQDCKLFKSSIYQNVKIGNVNASHEQVMRAMKQAGCLEIIEKFPEKEHTMIGTKGVFLSGGEKQRIAIARAILKDAKIIIMDEASAAVDPENEHELQKAFANLIKNKTVIMIAHRLSSVRSVDEILFVDKGKIIERGSDAELMAYESAYRSYQQLYAKANDWRIIHE